MASRALTTGPQFGQFLAALTSTDALPARERQLEERRVRRENRDKVWEVTQAAEAIFHIAMGEQLAASLARVTGRRDALEMTVRGEEAVADLIGAVDVLIGLPCSGATEAADRRKSLRKWRKACFTQGTDSMWKARLESWDAKLTVT